MMYRLSGTGLAWCSRVPLLRSVACARPYPIFHGANRELKTSPLSYCKKIGAYQSISNQFVSANVFKNQRSLSEGHEHAHSHGHEDAPKVSVTFVYEKDGKKQTVQGSVGMNLLRVAHANGVDLEGACECSLACSTCHLVLEDSLYQTLAEPGDKENDMLDLAFGLTPSSRLGCQVILTEKMDGAVFTIPSATRNMYVDGHVPKPH